MEARIKFVRYWIEIIFYKLLVFLGKAENTAVIPNGQYCYEIDYERNKKEPRETGFWIKMCPYYRGRQNVYPNACKYVGFVGFDFCLYDQCKICNVSND